jgi:hypothetical protein
MRSYAFVVFCGAAFVFGTTGCPPLGDFALDAGTLEAGAESGASVSSGVGGSGMTSGSSTGGATSGASGTNTSSGSAPSGSQSGGSGSAASGSASGATDGGVDAGNSQGVTCEAGSNCEPGYECVTLAGFGQCEQLCGSGQAACPTLFWCQTVGACTQQCNPLQPSVSDSLHQGCATGQRCDLELDTQAHTLCETASGNSKQGMSCPRPLDCAPGFACVTISGAMLCEEFCRVGTSFTDCTTGTCTSFKTTAFDGTQEIGVCQ